MALGIYVLVTNGSVVSSGLSNLQPIAIAVICIGGGIFLISFIGCCSAVHESRCFLGFYIFLVFLIIVAEVAIGAYAYVHKDTVLQEGNQLSYDAWAKLPPQTRLQIQKDLSCCGWSADKPVDLNCPVQAPEGQNPPFCRERISDFLHTSYKALGITAIVIGSLQIVCFIFAIILSCAVKRARDHEDRQLLLNQSRQQPGNPPPHVGYGAPHPQQGAGGYQRSY